LKTTESEHDIQKALIQWFRLQYPRRLKCLWAIPNGGYRHIRTSIKLKEEGLIAGVSDLFLMIPSGIYHGMFIELKTKKGRVQKNQEDFIMLAKSQGYQAKVCYGFDDAQNTIKTYLCN
jgi:hypothetical protein